MKQCPICNKRECFRWESACDICKTIQNGDKIKREILDGERDSTDCEDSIYCPYCGEIYEPCYADDSDLWVEGESERECGVCDKKFNIYVNVSHSYDTSRME